jgi:uncharacterized protein YbjT (DUF2867 family)
MIRQEEEEEEEENSLSKIENSQEIKILITGGSGFIGNRLLRNLIKGKSSNENKYRIRCLTRNRKSIINLEEGIDKNVEIVEGDLLNYSDCIKALSEIDIAYYLVHSMEGSTRNWKKFSEKEKITAENFKRASTECGVKRIIYLGGLIDEKDSNVSQHMLSRKQVGEILKNSKAKITIFRAAVILGSGGGSFEMLRYLVERLPVMICPKWVNSKCQPIYIDDVIEYLSQTIGKANTEGRTFDIGGPDILTYIQMMKIYSKSINKSIRVIIIPILTTKISSYWIDLVTPIKASLARPLVESLRHDSIVKDNTIEKIIPLQLKTFKESVKYCLKEGNKYKKISIKQIKKERTSFSLNYKILLISLCLLLFIGTTYYFLDTRHDFLKPFWLIIAIFWYLLIIFSIYFIRYGARLGALVAGIIGWSTLIFWLLDNYNIASGHSVLFTNPNINETWRNILGIIIASFTIISSHNIFNKSRHN